MEGEPSSILPATVTGKRKRRSTTAEKKKNRSHPSREKARQERTFSSASLLGPLDAQALSDQRERLLLKAKQLSFPEDATGSYKSVAVRKEYGRDVSLGGVHSLADYHKSILNTLLHEFLLRHQWHEAAGALSVLLRSALTDRSWNPEYLHYFWATMEVTRQMEGLQGNDNRFNKLYQVLHNKQPRNILTHDKTQAGAVRLEQALYLMGQNHYEEAQLASSQVIGLPEYRDNTVANMIHGLINYYMWIELVKQELAQGSSKWVNPHIKVEQMDLSEGMGENEQLSDHNSIFGTSAIRDHTKFGPDDDATSEDSSGKHLLRNLEIKLEQTILDDHKSSLGNIYGDVDMDEGVDRIYIRKARVILKSGMNKKLFPINLPNTQQGGLYSVPMGTVKVKGCHTTAIKHLRYALSLDDNLLMALLPLVQLMLAGCDVEGAYEAIEKCCRGSNDSLPVRLKRMLLESLQPINKDLLAQTYEEVLDRDPTCVDSLEGLILLHKAGDYKTESLFEYLVCHLDGSSGSLFVWRKLLLCFEEFRKLDDYVEFDEVSEEGMTQKVHSGVLEIFREDHLRSAWTTRKKWWPQKHFKSGCIEQELNLEGGYKRLVYKAACAYHIFGPSTPYASEVEEHLRVVASLQHLAKLQKHKENSLSLLDRYILV